MISVEGGSAGLCAGIRPIALSKRLRISGFRFEGLGFQACLGLGVSGVRFLGLVGMQIAECEAADLLKSRA